MAGSISGTIRVRGGESVPPGSVIEVVLLDVSRADAPADVIGLTSVAATGEPSCGFVLEYESGTVNDRHRYTVRASVTEAGRLVFTSTDHVDPFATPADNPVNIWMSAVPEARSPEGSSPLMGTTWTLTEIEGQPAPLGTGGQPVTLVLTQEGRTARGFSGCNRFAGTFELGEAGLRFGPLAGTRRACLDGMDLEREVLAALASVLGHRLDGPTLTLLRAGSDPVLAFTAGSQSTS